MASKLVLIDGNAIMHRAFHALPALTTRSGEPINAVYGLVSMLLKVIDDLKPTHLAVCFDEKAPTFRHKAYPDYQIQRPHMADELSGQFEKAKSVLSAMAIPFYSQPGYEADDLLGTIAKQAADNVVIVTGDRDILQLVSDRVKLYMPVAGLSNAKLMGVEETKEKLGVEPCRIVDYKALVGDPSDNYPGVPGIGPKTAIILLSKFKNLNSIYKNLDEIPKSVADKLKRDKKSAYLSQKLARIVTNVPIKAELEKAAKWQVNSKKLLGLFEEFGFKTLTKRVKDFAKKIDSKKQLVLI